MAIAFKKYQRQDSELTELGTVKSLAGKGGKVSFRKKNFSNKLKRVFLILENKKGESALIPCSKQVSDLVRAGEITINQLLGFPVVETELENSETGKMEMAHFITLPAGVNEQEFNVDTIESEEFENSADYLPESFVTA